MASLIHCSPPQCIRLVHGVYGLWSPIVFKKVRVGTVYRPTGPVVVSEAVASTVPQTLWGSCKGNNH